MNYENPICNQAEKNPDRKSSDRYLIVSLLPMVVGPMLSVAAFQIYLSFDTVTSEFNTPPKAAYCFLMQDCHFTQSVNWIRHQMYPDQEHRNNGGSCHLKRYKKGLHLFEQQVKTKQICQQLSPDDLLEFVCKWLYDTLECIFILCRLYRIRVHLFIFNAVSSLLKYMQFALQCNRSDLRAIRKRHQRF